MNFKLACPSCGQSGTWTVTGGAEIWTAPDGRKTAVVAGECDRCGSTVLFEPSAQAVERIRNREMIHRSRLARLRAGADD